MVTSPVQSEPGSTGTEGQAPTYVCTCRRIDDMHVPVTAVFKLLPAAHPSNIMSRTETYIDYICTYVINGSYSIDANIWDY